MKRKATDFSPHLERYVFAMRHCLGKKTIDVGGKSGYGADILSYIQADVTVVDNASRHLKKYKGNSILMDLNETYPDEMWDAAVAFEIIEHVKDPDNLVKNIVEHLNPGGVLVFSVSHMKEHESHLTLFDEQKIRDLISKYLVIEEFYIQDRYVISGIPFTVYPVTYVGVAIKYE